MDITQAAVDVAKANLVMAEATVRGLGAGTQPAIQARARHRGRGQPGRSHPAAGGDLGWKQASLVLAQEEFDRAKRLLASKVVSKKNTTKNRRPLPWRTRRLHRHCKMLSGSGLPRCASRAACRNDLAEVPPDLDQTFSSVRQAMRSPSKGRPTRHCASSYNLTPKEMIDEFYRRDPQGDIDKIYAQVMHDAPSLKQAQAKLAQAQRNLDQAKLNLSYCDGCTEIDGVITRRKVNPGNNVQVGQSLMAIRSLPEIWVDANFKETQLRDLRIGQPVELKVECTAAQNSVAGSLASPWAPARPWHCCRRKTRRAIS